MEKESSIDYFNQFCHHRDGQGSLGYPRLLFYKLNGSIPNTFSVSRDGSRFDIDKILKLYPDIQYFGAWEHDGKKSVNLDVIIKIKDNILFSVGDNQHYVLIFTSLPYDNLEILEIIKNLRKCRKRINKQKSNLYLIEQNREGFDLDVFEIEKSKIDLTLNYNDDFPEVSGRIINSLKKESKGIALLHGVPGTGKTTYIRYLLSQIKDKQIIYIPPDFAGFLSDPQFIGFMKQQSGSILVIEDAENIIQKRGGKGNQSVANLLNLTDGLLGDCFKVQVVCTFNTSISNIDEALLRKGRLIAEYEFKSLTQEKVKVLAESLGMEYSKEATLAEVYNYKEKEHKAKPRERIGFLTN